MLVSQHDMFPLSWGPRSCIVIWELTNQQNVCSHVFHSFSPFCVCAA
jgi:hypothetical protein